MTKKDYELIAGTVRAELDQWKQEAGEVYGQEGVKAIEQLVMALGDSLYNDNSNFDYTRFAKACGLTD